MQCPICQSPWPYLSVYLGQFFSVVREILKGYDDLIKIGIETLAKAIPRALKAIGTTAVEWFKKIDWFRLGQNIVLGIIEGIGSAVGWLVDKIVGLGQAALDAALNFFGINSPSKLFRDRVGRFLPEGAAVGVEKNTGLLVDSIEDMGDEALDAAERAFSDGSLFDVIGNFMDGLDPEGVDEISVTTIPSEENGSPYPSDNITFNVYGSEGQDEKTIAEEVMKLFTLWDDQRRRAFA